MHEPHAIAPTAGPDAGTVSAPSVATSIRRLVLAWALLVVAAVVGWWWGRAPGAAVVLGVMVVAALKVVVIGREFMELRTASPAFSRGLEVWAAVVTLVVVVALW